MKNRKTLIALLPMIFMVLLWSGCTHLGAAKAGEQAMDDTAVQQEAAPSAGEERSEEAAPSAEEERSEEVVPLAEEERSEEVVLEEASKALPSPEEEMETPRTAQGQGEETDIPADTDEPVPALLNGQGPGVSPAPTEGAPGEGGAERAVLPGKPGTQGPAVVSVKRTPPPFPPAPPAGGPVGVAPVAEPVSSVTLNFDNADIYQVIKTISNLLGLNYIIDPSVKGTVNIHSRGRITKSDLYDIFNSILKVNGAAVVKEGELHHIVPTSSVKTRLLIPRVESEGLDPHPNDEVVLEVIRLRFFSATKIVNILKPFVSRGADVTPFENNNIVLVTDFARNVEKLIEIIDLIDVNIFEEVGLRIYPIHEADVQEVAQDMQKIFAAFDVKTTSGMGAGINFIPVSRINSLLVITSVPQAFEEVEKWLVELDRNISRDEVRTFIYHVKNGIAGELADILNSVFAGAKLKKTPVPRSSPAAKADGPGKAAQPQAKPPSRKPSETIIGEVKVIPYPTTNTIIIKATPRDYTVVKKILEELDIMPRQVLIEILVAEVTLTDEMTLGVEYAVRGDEVSSGIREDIVGTALGLSTAGTLATGGLTASIVKDSFLGTINALASKNQINILASPHIIATDGKEAGIDIGDEVPLVASKIFIDQREEITIERRDTGVILKVTPHINTTGLVTLDLSLEISSAAKAIVQGESDIRIFQRNANTTMVVQDNQTIVIGGLIDETTEQEVSKVPFLGDIPLLGLLFRTTKDSAKKTELVLLITPHVIRDLDDANDVTREFIEKLKGLRRSLEEDGTWRDEG